METNSSFERIFSSCGREWRIRCADMDTLWDSMAENGKEAPYWNEVWPSSLALAEWLGEKKNDIRGKRCLDMGCGLGFTALAGQWLGACVTGMDYEEEALAYARENAALNNIAGVRWEAMDWRSPSFPPCSFDVIWAGDIMYEKDFAPHIGACIATMLRTHGKAWIAEPGRAVFRNLLSVLPRYGLAFHRVRSLPVFPLTRQKVPVPVSLWELTRTHGPFDHLI